MPRMTRILATAAALALGVSAAAAECDYHKTVQASEPDKTVVASVGDTALPPAAMDEAPKAEDAAKAQ